MRRPPPLTPDPLCPHPATSGAHTEGGGADPEPSEPVQLYCWGDLGGRYSGGSERSQGGEWTSARGLGLASEMAQKRDGLWPSKSDPPLMVM